MFLFTRRHDAKPRARWYNDLIFYIISISSAIVMLILGTCFMAIVSIYNKVHRGKKDDSSE
jgi:hypothetical protein